MLKSAKGILYLLLLSIGAICGYFALLPVAFTVLIPLEIVTKWRAIYVHIVSRHYFGFAAAVIELLCNTQIFIYADTPEILDDIPVIFICNHHTRVDWMYSWSYSAMLNNFICPSFILKDSLKTLPFFGWCMQALMYIFLERKKEKDIPKIERLLRYLSTYCSNPSVFLYPEGTDLSPSNLEKSHKCMSIKISCKYML